MSTTRTGGSRGNWVCGAHGIRVRLRAPRLGAAGQHEVLQRDWGSHAHRRVPASNQTSQSSNCPKARRSCRLCQEALGAQKPTRKASRRELVGQPVHGGRAGLGFCSCSARPIPPRLRLDPEERATRGVPVQEHATRSARAKPPCRPVGCEQSNRLTGVAARKLELRVDHVRPVPSFTGSSSS